MNRRISDLWRGPAGATPPAAGGGVPHLETASAPPSAEVLARMVAADLAAGARLALLESALERDRQDLHAATHPAPGALEPVLFYRHDFARAAQMARAEGRNPNMAAWMPDQAAVLGADGHVTIGQKHSTPGIRSPRIATPGGGLYEIRLQGDFARIGTARPFLRVLVAGSSEILCADAPLDLAPGAETRLVFYQPARVRDIELRILTERAYVGLRFRLDRVMIGRCDIDAHQAGVAARLGAPVIASLASIPTRRAMLRDAVATLLAQCDEVRVFLNNYPDLPDFLIHPRVTVRRSQDYDDNGDAGKFGWVEAPDPPGYRIICDDDLLFPPDLAERLIARVRATDDRAMVGLHGVMLRQPVTQYYAPDARHAVHFQARMDHPKEVHILATCVMATHSRQLQMRSRDFMARNMGDIWLTKHAQDNDIPLIIIERPWKWVRENKQAAAYETIYENSLKRTGSAFDSSFLQDAVLKDLAPVSLRPWRRPLAVMVITAANLDHFRACHDAYLLTRGETHEWITVAVVTRADAALQDWLTRMPFSGELHVLAPPVPGPDDSPDASTADDVPDGAPLPDWDPAPPLARLLGQLRYDMGVAVDARVRLHTPDWRGAAWVAFAAGGAAQAGFALVDGDLQPAHDAAPDISFFHRRAFVPATPAAPASPAADIMVARILMGGVARSDQPGAGEDAAAVTARGLDLRSLAAAPAPLRQTMAARWSGGARINDLFERVVLLNLDRRPDRLDSARATLARHGVTAERHRAVDGQWPEVQEAWRQYALSPLRSVGPGLPAINNSHDYYPAALSQAQRTAHVETSGHKAIATPGAWAYLMGMTQILERAIRDGVESLLVLDDDVRLHRDTQALFGRAVADLPDDWMILQLGSLQYHWTGEWIDWTSPHLYRKRGAAVGSHAVGLHRRILPFLLDRCRRMELPYDDGPLSAATQAFPDRNFVIYPHLAIQAIGDSDIQSSGFQRQLDRAAIFRRYRWQAADYDGL